MDHGIDQHGEPRSSESYERTVSHCQNTGQGPVGATLAEMEDSNFLSRVESDQSSAAGPRILSSRRRATLMAAFARATAGATGTDELGACADLATSWK